MDAINYALKLECAFNRFGCNKRFSADSMRLKPTEAIEDGLNWLVCKSIISKDDYSHMCQEFNFENSSLQEIVSDENGKSRIDDLLNQLKNLAKKGD